jgi:hypothetical protein
MDARLRSECQAVGRPDGIGGRTAVRQRSSGSSDRKGQRGGVFGRWWYATPQQGHRQGWRKRERGEGEGACEKLRRQEDEQILLEEEETQESYDFDPTVDILLPEKK